MPGKETYISVQTAIWKKLNLAEKLNIKTIGDRGKVNGFISSLRSDKKITTETDSVKQLKDVEKYITNNFDEFKKRYESYKPKPKTKK